MKTLFTKTIFLLLTVLVHASPEYVVAVKGQQGLKLSDGNGWTLELGEVFPFIRWVSVSELRGEAPDPSDKSAALVQMDDLTLIVPSACIQQVEDKDLAAAAMNYRQIVQAHRAELQRKKDEAVAAGQAIRQEQEARKQRERDEAVAASQAARQQQQDARSETARALELWKSFEGSGLSRNDRIRMLYVLRNEGVISSIRKGEQMPDTQIIELYNRAMEQRRLRGIENAVRDLQR
jgi:hypothetical protein